MAYCLYSRVVMMRTLVRWISLPVLLVISPSLWADYAVQIGAFGFDANAQRSLSSVRSDGFPAYLRKIVRPSGKPLTFVLVGPYQTRQAAEAVLSSLQQRDIKGYVVNVPEAPPSPAKPLSPEERPIPPETMTPAATEEGEPSEVMPPEMPEGSEMSPVVVPPEASSITAPGQETTGNENFLETLSVDEGASSLSGFFQSELAYKWPEPDHFSLFRHTLDLHGRGSWGSWAQWRLGGRMTYDSVFDITDAYPRSVEQDQRFDAKVWETYLDLSAGGWDFRLGRQQIIWGEMVGLFFADVVSAKDMRQFVLPDFDMIRIPQWAVRGELFSGDYHTELIWIPYPTYDESGVPGSDFYAGPLPPPSGFAQVIRGERHPAGGLDQSGYGLRFSALKSGWDMAGFYYGSMDAQPTYFRQVTTVGSTPTLIYTPDHRRIDQVGGTLSKDFSPWVLKGEMVYTRGRYFEVSRLNQLNGVVKQDYLDYAIGLDYAGLERSRINVQLFQRWFPEHDADIAYKPLESGVTLFFSTLTEAGTFEPQLLVMTGLNRGDWLARPRLIWHAGDHWRLSVGADMFGGSRSGLFGRYDGEDRVYGDVRYTF